MISGHMIDAAVRTRSGQGRFMFRVGMENDAAATALPGGEPLIQGGRRNTGFYFIDEDEASPDTFHSCLSLAVSHAMSLTPKIASPKTGKDPQITQKP